MGDMNLKMNMKKKYIKPAIILERLENANTLIDFPSQSAYTGGDNGNLAKPTIFDAPEGNSQSSGGSSSDLWSDESEEE